jgi:hypothetical protein
VTIPLCGTSGEVLASCFSMLNTRLWQFRRSLLDHPINRSPDSSPLGGDKYTRSSAGAESDFPAGNFPAVERRRPRLRSREFPESARRVERPSGSFDSPSSRSAGLGLAQDDRPKNFRAMRAASPLPRKQLGAAGAATEGHFSSTEGSSTAGHCRLRAAELRGLGRLSAEHA